MAFAIQEGFDVMERLATGLDVNVKFNSIFGFEATQELVMFDLLDISLVHGWLVDPEDRDTAAVFADHSYNVLVDTLIAGAPTGLLLPYCDGSSVNWWFGAWI